MYNGQVTFYMVLKNTAMFNWSPCKELPMGTAQVSHLAGRRGTWIHASSLSCSNLQYSIVGPDPNLIASWIRIRQIGSGSKDGKIKVKLLKNDLQVLTMLDYGHFINSLGMFFLFMGKTGKHFIQSLKTFFKFIFLIWYSPYSSLKKKT